MVNAPRLLADLFWELSGDTPITYEKTAHSVALTKWMLENKPAQLAELMNYVVDLLAEKT